MTSAKVPDLGGATMDVIDLGEFIQPHFMKTGPEIKDIFEKVPSYKFRDDDVMLLTYVKTGTNWMYEVLSMILSKSSEHVKTNKMATMMEAKTPDDMESVPSPRVMNIHYPYRYLPVKGLREKQTKTILCLRNPKDTAVSYYNHMRGIKFYNYSGEWNNWLPVYTQGKLEYGKYTDYLKEFETAIQEGTGFPLHVMYYEDLKMNGLEELDKLIKFLDIELDEELKKNIIDMCGFDKMLNKPWDGVDSMFNEGYKFMRKGTIGDWMSWFTLAQNEEFDKMWKSEMEGHDMFKFKYTMRQIE